MENSSNKNQPHRQNDGSSNPREHDSNIYDSSQSAGQNYNDSESRATRAESSDTGDDHSNTSTGSAYSASARKESETDRDYGFSSMNRGEDSAEETDN